MTTLGSITPIWGPRYVFEIPERPDRDALAQQMKSRILNLYPGSVVTLVPHPRGSMRIRAMLPGGADPTELEASLYLHLVADNVSVYTKGG